MCVVGRFGARSTPARANQLCLRAINAVRKQLQARLPSSHTYSPSKQDDRVRGRYRGNSGAHDGARNVCALHVAPQLPGMIDGKTMSPVHVIVKAKASLHAGQTALPVPVPVPISPTGKAKVAMLEGKTMLQIPVSPTTKVCLSMLDGRTMQAVPVQSCRTQASVYQPRSHAIYARQLSAAYTCGHVVGCVLDVHTLQYIKTHLPRSSIASAKDTRKSGVLCATLHVLLHCESSTVRACAWVSQVYLPYHLPHQVCFNTSS